MHKQALYQQGDCLLVKVKNIPESAKSRPASKRGHILAEGEFTGHAHVLEACPDVELFEDNGTLYVRAAKQVTLKHEEHAAQIIAPGTYRVRKVVEVDPFTKEISAIRD